MGVNEVASHSVYAKMMLAEILALFGFVLNVDLIVLEQFVTPMGKFASLLIGTKPTFHEPSAEL